MVKKISIIGSGGVGSNLAFHILNTINPFELALVDVKKNQAKAVACDLEDSRGFLGFSTKIKAGKNYSLIKNSQIIIFTAGMPRKEGMSRLDLLEINAAIARMVSCQIKELSPESIVIVVTNPLDIITYIVLKETGFSPKRVIGMGSSLDTSRLLAALAKETEISVCSHKGLAFGPHSKDMLVTFDDSFLDGKGNIFKKNEIIRQVKQRGAEIVSLFGNKSAVFSPALACCRLVEAIVFDKNQIIPVSTLLFGQYGLKDLCLGVPCLINRQGVGRIIEKKITSGQKKSLQKVALLLKKSLKNF